MKRLIILTGLCIFAGSSQLYCQANSLDITFKCYSYSIDTQQINVCSADIKNTSGKDYVLWLERQNITTLSPDNKVKLYFFKTKPDFNLYTLIVEKLLKPEPPVVFDTFLKKVKSDEHFTLKIIGPNITTGKLERFIAEHMVFMELSELEHRLKLNEKSLPWYAPGEIIILDPVIR